MQMRHRPKSRRNPRVRPQRWQRLTPLLENFGVRLLLAIWAFVAIILSLLLPERHSQELEEAACFLVRLGARHYGDVHAAYAFGLVEGHFGEHDLFADSQAVVAAAVERGAGHRAGVTTRRAGAVARA